MYTHTYIHVYGYMSHATAECASEFWNGTATPPLIYIYLCAIYVYDVHIYIYIFIDVFWNYLYEILHIYMYSYLHHITDPIFFPSI